MAHRDGNGQRRKRPQSCLPSHRTLGAFPFPFSARALFSQLPPPPPLLADELFPRHDTLDLRLATIMAIVSGHRHYCRRRRRRLLCASGIPRPPKPSTASQKDKEEKNPFLPPDNYAGQSAIERVKIVPSFVPQAEKCKSRPFVSIVTRLSPIAICSASVPRLASAICQTVYKKKERNPPAPPIIIISSCSLSPSLARTNKARLLPGAGCIECMCVCVWAGCAVCNARELTKHASQLNAHWIFLPSALRIPCELQQRPALRPPPLTSHFTVPPLLLPAVAVAAAAAAAAVPSRPARRFPRQRISKTTRSLLFPRNHR